MKTTAINPTSVSYAQAHLATDFNKLLFISGQVPADEANEVPVEFKDQARLAWKNVEVQLHAAGMTLDNLVKVTTFLSDRKYRQDNYEVRTEVLGPRCPALTIIITGIYDEAWLLEIEGVAVG